MSLAVVLGLLSGFLVWRQCRRREKFTSKYALARSPPTPQLFNIFPVLDDPSSYLAAPIEETGGEGCPGVALIQ